MRVFHAGVKVTSRDYKSPMKVETVTVPCKEAESLATKDAVTNSVPRCVVPHVLKSLHEATEKIDVLV